MATQKTSPQKNEPGLIYVFTGDGKGKTSAALGVAVRALAHGWNVDWIALYKEVSWNISEFSLPNLLTDEHKQRFHMHILGKGFYIADAKQNDKKIKTAPVGKSTIVVDDNTADEHQQAAEAALARAHMLLDSDQPPAVLVLDELCNALNDSLLDWKDVKNLLEKRGGTHIIITGRNATQELIAAADLVSTVQKTKHPYDSGKLAVKGLDF